MSSIREVKRKSYSKIKSVAQPPNLLQVQVESFEEFLQLNVDPEKRENKGLQTVFKEIFPITDVHENFSLEFKVHAGDPPL